MDSIIWMDDDVVMMPSSIGGLHIISKGKDGERVNAHIQTLNALATWLNNNGYKHEENTNA